jgi:transcriptional regulator with XRE-family HTH domain
MSTNKGKTLDQTTCRRELGEALRSARRRAGQTQAETSYAIGIDRSTLAKWEAGDSMPDLDLVIRLLNTFDISFAELIGDQHAISQYEEIDRRLKALGG